MGWRERRRKGIWSEKHGRNVLMIEAVTLAQQAGKSLIVSNLKLEFFLFRSGINILTEIRYILRYGWNDSVQASILSGTKQTGWTGQRFVRFFGWTSIRPVLSELMYIRFLMLKKPDFSSVPGFLGRTAQSGPGFKTLVKGCQVIVTWQVNICCPSVWSRVMTRSPRWGTSPWLTT